MPRTPPKERHKPKQAAVIQAAAELFVSHGYDGTSTEMIAEKAGVSRQTIYNQFERKELLFLAIVSGLVGEMVAPLTDAADRAEDVRATLLALGQRIHQTYLSPKTMALRRLAVAELSRFPELARSLYEAGPLVAQEAIASYLGSQNQLRITDPALAARQFLGLVVHPYELRGELGIEFDDKQMQRELHASVDMFMGAYRAD